MSTSTINPTLQAKNGPQSPRPPTPAECATHLRLLNAFVDLRSTVKTRGGDKGLEDEQAWRLFCRSAAARFLTWTATVDASGPSLPVPPLDVLLVWHAFMLNPRSYQRYANGTLQGRLAGKGINWEGLDFASFEAATLTDCLDGAIEHPGRDDACTVNGFDMVAAIQRQFKFSEKMHRAKWLESGFSGDILAMAVSRYEKFFTIISEHPGVGIAPTQDIDLVWHTHMLSPKKYAVYSRARTGGKLVNHDDNLAKDTLAKSAADASRLFRDKFQMPYRVCLCEPCVAARFTGRAPHRRAHQARVPHDPDSCSSSCNPSAGCSSSCQSGCSSVDCAAECTVECVSPCGGGGPGDCGADCGYVCGASAAVAYAGARAAFVRAPLHRQQSTSRSAAQAAPSRWEQGPTHIVLAMGNESSQLEKDPVMARSGGRVIGPPMSPIPRADSDVEETGRTFGPSMSPLPSDNEPDPTPMSVVDPPKSAANKKKRRRKSEESVGLPEPETSGARQGARQETASPASTRKSKRKSRTRQVEDQTVIESTQPGAQNGPVDEHGQSAKKKPKKRAKKHTTHDEEAEGAPVGVEEGFVTGNGANEVDDATLVEDTPQSSATVKKRQNRARKKKNNKNNDDQQALVSHALGGSPPSAQQPVTNGAVKYEHDEGAPQDGDEELQFHFAGIASAENNADGEPGLEATGGSEPLSSFEWLHKRESGDQNGTPVTDTRTDQEREQDEALPDLQPSQIKAERESDGESDSPSAARLERLEESRSRSASRASTARSGLSRPADQDLALSTRPPLLPSSRTRKDRSLSHSAPDSAPSSTGSNASIPAQILVTDAPASATSSRPASRRSNKSEAQGDEAGATSQAASQAAEQENVSPPKQTRRTRITRASASRKPNEATVDDVDSPAAIQATAKAARPARKQDQPAGHDEPPNRNGHLMEEWLSSQGGMNGGSEEAEEIGANANISVTRNQDADDIALGESASEIVRGTQQRDVQDGQDGQDGQDVQDGQDGQDVQDVQDVQDGQDGQDGQDVQDGQPVQDGQSVQDGQPVHDAQPIAAVQAKSVTAANKSPTPPSRDADAALISSSKNKGTKRRVQKAKPTSNLDIDETTKDTNNQDATEPREDSIEPDDSASQLQPKPKKKRKLQPKTSLSLTQIEGDEDEDGPSRLPSLSQQSKAREAMRGGSIEAEESEVGASQEPTPLPKARKTKRKRRDPNNASEDEMESLLAAGPSRGRKRPNKLGLSDDEGAGASKRRKKLSNGDRASGAWTDEELSTLGRVVDDFLTAHGMTQHELNALIHEVPIKTNDLHQEFWKNAASAISKRPRKAVMERTRRLYHNFVARGTWTDEQKEEVNELLQRHGNKFSEIAAMINRDQKDVRDYWRNNYLVHQTQVKSRWTEEEEDRLKQVVEEALGMIRVMRENNDQFRPRPRAKGIDDESLLDWQQISSKMNRTRSRQQCKWKWIDMREKGLVGDESVVLPRSGGNSINGISDELANARDDYRAMSEQDKLRLVDAIHDGGESIDGRIRWSTLVDEVFRTRWKRPTLKIAWHRLRRTVPDYDENDVQTNARYLLNQYHTHQCFPQLDDSQVEDEVEEKIMHRKPGSRLWKKASDEPRAPRGRQRQSSNVSSHASNRLSRRVSSEILGFQDSEDAAPSRVNGRSDSIELGSAELGSRRGRRAHKEDVPIRIPKHLKGEEAKKALEEARARASAKTPAGGGGARSASVAVDSDSE